MYNRKNWIAVTIAILGLAMFVPFAEAQDRFNSSIAKLKAGQPVFAIFSYNRDMLNARAIGRSNLDYIIYDSEHGQFDMEIFRQFVDSMKTPDGKFKVTPSSASDPMQARLSTTNG